MYEQIKSDVDLILDDIVEGLSDTSAVSASAKEYTKEEVRRLAERRMELYNEKKRLSEELDAIERALKAIEIELYDTLEPTLKPNEIETVLVGNKNHSIKLVPKEEFYVRDKLDFEIADFFVENGFGNPLSINFQTLQSICRKAVEAEVILPENLISRSIKKKIDFSRGKKA